MWIRHTYAFSVRDVERQLIWNTLILIVHTTLLDSSLQASLEGSSEASLEGTLEGSLEGSYLEVQGTYLLVYGLWG